MNNHKTLIRKSFSAYILAFRKERGLTQEAMAERLHISSRAYSDLERGRYSLSAATLLFFLLLLNEQEQLALLRQFRQELLLFERVEVA